MSECERIRIPHKKICVGDLRYRISLRNRQLGPPRTGVDITHEFVEFRRPWAAIKTMNGPNMFSGVNLDETPTHIFYIRHFPDLTAQSWVYHNDERYNILQVENINERNEWYALYCNQRGDINQDSTSF